MFNYESCIKEGKTKRRTMIYKILHRKLKIKQHEANKKGWTHVRRSGRFCALWKSMISQVPQ